MPRLNVKLVAVASTAALLMSAVVGIVPSSATSKHVAHSKSPLTYGELLPITGPIAAVIAGVIQGANVATKVINNSGGVLGHPLVAAAQDTTGDIADAITGFRSLELKHPVFELGPTSLEAAGVINLYGPAHLPDFTADGSPSLDVNHLKYVYRTLPSDSNVAKGMAAYAIHKGYTRAALMFESSSNAQEFTPVLTKGYTSHGGTVTSNVTLTAGQTDYSSEIEQVFATNPQVIFMQVDAQTAGTLFANMTTLNDVKVPIIMTNDGTNPAILAAVGPAIAQKWVTAVNATSPTNSSGYKSFVSYWKHYEHSNTPALYAATLYDSINIAALAMTEAKSTNPTVWNRFVRLVADGPGKACYRYSQCQKILRSGQKISYQSAGGVQNFDKYNGLNGSFDVEQSLPSGSFNILYQESSKLIAGY